MPTSFIGGHLGKWLLMAWAKKKICLFPTCCHFNQWVGRKFIIFFFFCHFNQLVGKFFFLNVFGTKFTSMHVLSVHYLKIFLGFLPLFDPPVLFVTFFRVTSITVSNSPLNLWIS